jgi:hypothetical protein
LIVFLCNNTPDVTADRTLKRAPVNPPFFSMTLTALVGPWPLLQFRSQGREADHSTPFSAEVKNGGATSPLPHTSSWHSA